LASLAPDEAVRHFSEALRLVELAGDGDSVAACDLRVDLGRAEQQAGISGFRETFLDAANRALALDATDPLIDAALANTRGWFSASGVVDVERIVVIEAALNAIAAGDCSERALLLGTLCQELSFGPLDRRVSLAADAKAMARRLGDPTTLVRVLSKLDNPLQIPFALEDRRADANEALGIAESLGDPELLFHTLSMCQVNAIQAGDFAAATACMDRMSAINECLRHPTLAWMTMFKEAGMAVMMGEPERAEEAAGAAVAVGTDSGQPDALTIFGSQVMFARMQQGRLGELVGMVDKAVADNPGLPGFRAILAATHLDAGNHSTALAILEQAAGDGFASLPLDFVWMIAVTGYALVASELRAAEPAERLYDLLAPHGRQIPFIGTVGYFPCSWSLGALAGVLGRYDAAETHFAAAAELCARGSMRYYSAATDLAWGRMLIQRRELGDVERGRSLLAQAQASASRCGYTLIGQRAESALSAADE
jgi:tetratricopeptide (TPR) repeat protein